MEQRKNQRKQHLLPEIQRLLEEGQTQREIAESLGLTGERPVHNLLKRERKKQRESEQGKAPKRRAGPRNAPLTAEEEVRQLRMENELLRDFLRLAGRR